jgi:hypothetical protein
MMHHMNTPLKYPSVRCTVPVPIEAHEAFQQLARVMGKSVGSVMGEWLMDGAEGARHMAEQLEAMQRASRNVSRDVHALATAVIDATDLVLSRAQDGPSAGAGHGTRSGSRAASADGLTPPSSNTGGKVHQFPNENPKKGPR